MINETMLSVRDRENSPLHRKKLGGLLDILIAFAPLAAFGFIGTRLGAGTLFGGTLITSGYLLTIIVASGVLKRRGTGWREIGLARPQNWLRTVLLGIAAMVGAALVSLMVSVIALNLPGLASQPPDVSRFNPLEGNLPLFIGYVVLAWTAIAFGEEMFFRAFLTTRLAELFQNTKAAWAFAAIGSSVAFGFAHLQEGPVGVLSTAAIGLLWAWVYLRTGRNLWVTIIAHGLLNTLRFALVFAGAV